MTNLVRLIAMLAVVVLVQTAAPPSEAEGGRRAHPQSAAPPERQKLPEVLVPIAKYAELQSVLGREVKTRIDEDTGRIIDLLADRDGQVHAAVIEFGGFLGIGTRKIAVEWSALRFENVGKHPTVIVDVTRDQLRAAPEYKPNEPAVVRRVSDY